MNATLVIVKKLKALIAKLTRQIAIGVHNARKYILELIDSENQLEAMDKNAKLSATAQRIKDRFLEGINKGYSEEREDLQQAALEAANHCWDSKYWQKWGCDLLDSRWKSSGELEVLSSRLRSYAKKATSENPIDKIILDCNDNGLSCKEWSNYGKKRLYLYDEFGEDFGYIDITKTPESKATGEYAGLVKAIVANY